MRHIATATHFRSSFSTQLIVRTTLWSDAGIQVTSRGEVGGQDKETTVASILYLPGFRITTNSYTVKSPTHYAVVDSHELAQHEFVAACMGT